MQKYGIQYVPVPSFTDRPVNILVDLDASISNAIIFGIIPLKGGYGGIEPVIRLRRLKGIPEGRHSRS